MPDVLADEIRAVLDTMGDPERAPEQQRYMKSTMPYRGIVMAELRSTVRSVVRVSEHRPGGRDEWERTIRPCGTRRRSGRIATPR
ncbi:MAG: DNA alkylation repair protein [Ilumatobacteraceae bacterium]